MRLQLFVSYHRIWLCKFTMKLWKINMHLHGWCIHGGIVRHYLWEFGIFQSHYLIDQRTQKTFQFHHIERSIVQYVYSHHLHDEAESAGALSQWCLSRPVDHKGYYCKCLPRSWINYTEMKPNMNYWNIEWLTWQRQHHEKSKDIEVPGQSTFIATALRKNL